MNSKEYVRNKIGKKAEENEMNVCLNNRIMDELIHIGILVLIYHMIVE